MCGKEYEGSGRTYCSKNCANLAQIKDISYATELLDKTIDDSLDVDSPLCVDTDFAIIIGDLHVPTHSKYWLTRSLEVGHWFKTIFKDKKTICIINGDFVDLEMFSRFGTDRKDITFKESVSTAAGVLDAIMAVYDEVYWLQGNHDMRFAKKFDYHLGFNDLCSLVKEKVTVGLWDNITTTEKNFVIVNDSWYIIHPYNYAKAGTTLACKYAMRHQANFVLAHQHHSPAFAMSENGQFFGVDGGCMIDAKKTKYIQDKITLYPNWVNGFVALMRDQSSKTRFRLYSDHLTDWAIEQSALGVYRSSNIQ